MVDQIGNSQLEALFLGNLFQKFMFRLGSQKKLTLDSTHRHKFKLNSQSQEKTLITIEVEVIVGIKKLFFKVLFNNNRAETIMLTMVFFIIMNFVYFFLFFM